MTDTQAPVHTDAYLQLQSQIVAALDALASTPGFKQRNAQRHMIGDIARTMMTSGLEHPIMAIEAGTGTGKTYGYCLPLIPIVQLMEKRLVISTATVALQDQLFQHDLPMLKQQTGWDFSYVLAKGRRRYLCPMRLLSAVSGQQTALFESNDVVVDYAQKLKVAMDAGWAGDLDELSFSLPSSVHQAFTTDAAGCTNRKCQHFDICPYFTAKKHMLEATVVVTNHALLIADLNLGGGVVLPHPSESYHVIDEGHRLAGEVLAQGSSSHHLQGARTWLDSLVKMTHGMGSHGDEDYQTDIGNWPERIVEQSEALKRLLQQVYALVGQHPELSLSRSSQTNNQRSNNNQNDKRLSSYRFPHGQLPEYFHEIGALLLTTSTTLSDALAKAYDITQQALNRMQASDLIKQQSDLGFFKERVSNVVKTWQLLLDHNSKPPKAKWLDTDKSKGDTVDYAFSASPIEAKTYLQEKLWAHTCGCVLTSATITALGAFDYFLEQHGLDSEHTFCKRLPSPFDYANAATLTVSKEIDGKDPKHTLAIIDWLTNNLNPHEGTLILCTSKSQMNAIYDIIKDQFNIQLQDTQPKAHLIEQHKHTIDQGKGSVLMGLDSFGEGLNLPGNYCTHVVICKLPFPVPSSPVEEAQAEYIESQGKRPFDELAVPFTSAKLTQWVGRLLRTESDTGRVSILDNRLLTKYYGRKMLGALPGFKR